MEDGSGGRAAGSADPSAEATSLRFLCHELRQPLVVAVGYVSMLEEGSFGTLPDQAQAIVRTVAERLDALNDLIERVLSREAGPEPRAPEN